MTDPRLLHALEQVARQQRTANQIALANTDGGASSEEREQLLSQARMECGLRPLPAR